MFARLFRSNQPGILVLVLLLVPALFLRHLWATAPDMHAGMPLARLLHGLFSSTARVYGVTVLALIALLAVQVAVFMNEMELIGRRNHLPALLFPVLLATAAQPGSVGPALFGMPFMLWAIRRAWSISNTGKALGPLFDAGLLLGIASLVFMPYVILLAVIWASTSVVRPFQWREYIVPVLGSALVFYLAWGVLALSGVHDWEPLRTVGMPDGPSKATVGVYRWTLIALLLPIALVALLRFAEHYGRGVVREQNLRSAFIALGMALGLVCGFLQLLNGSYPAILEAVPLSMLFTFAFVGTRRAWLGETAVGLLFAMALWMQYGSPLV
ncbi:MAG: hypothetical protein JNM62_01075 [Flavobacteriales bacterium]|nr:hypothetical protein [Flavobacteriales bacterium]